MVVTIFGRASAIWGASHPSVRVDENVNRGYETALHKHEDEDGEKDHDAAENVIHPDNAAIVHQRTYGHYECVPG